MKETPERPEAIIDPPDRSFPLLKTIRWVNWNKLKVISGYSRYFNDLLVGKLSGLSVTACLALSLEARRELGGGGGGGESFLSTMTHPLLHLKSTAKLTNNVYLIKCTITYIHIHAWRMW